MTKSTTTDQLTPPHSHISSSPVEITWSRPTDPSLHAHFDCFSGAAGDMLLAACLDASGKPDRLRNYISHCLEQGLPELKGEFQIRYNYVTRGMGSIAGCHVHVESKYQHQAAPVPTSTTATTTTINEETTANNSQHSHSSHSHENSSSHSHDHHSHDHGHSHAHSHGHRHHDAVVPTINEQNQEVLSPTNNKKDHHSSSHNHSHGHSHGHNHDHLGPLRNLVDIRRMLQEAPNEYISEWVRDTSIAIFTELAHAEAKTHGAESIDAVHFHEVGAVDSIVDTVGTVLALHALGISSFSCSRLPLGEGTVWTAHGILPVPAPATLRLMVGMPVCQGPRGARGELVTPTGAAILRVLAMKGCRDQKGEAPLNFTVQKIGIGAGTKDFEKHPNILRLIIGNR